jgi:hypothetical protein
VDNRPTTTEVAFQAVDVDQDNHPDFAAIGSVVLPIDDPPPAEDRWPEVIALAGVIVSAAIAAISVIVAARINRDGGAEIAALHERVQVLEGESPTGLP